jgi:hypothetical protein
MDVLGFLISKVENKGLLKPLSPRTVQYHVSIYTNNVVLFLQLVAEDINLVVDLL